MKKLLLCLALVLGSDVPVLADSFTPLSPVAPVSAGVTTTPLHGITGSCLSYRVTSSGTLLSSMDCSGNVAANSFVGATINATGLTPGDCVQAGASGVLTSASSACGGGGGGSTIYTLWNKSGDDGLFNGETGYYALSNMPFSTSAISINHLYYSCEPYNTTTGLYSTGEVDGGVITISDVKLNGTVTTIGTLTVAGGSNITVEPSYGSTTLGSTYSFASNDTFTATTTVPDTGTNQWQGCTISVGS
jgi:hypothetical protein